MHKASFAGKAGTLMWDIYAGAYDDLVINYKPYREVLNEAYKYAAALKKRGKKTILDAGCGTGELSMRLLNRDNKLKCVDISGSMLKIFKEKLNALPDGSKKPDVINCDLNGKLPFRNMEFDAVVSVHALFMLENIFLTLDEFDRVLKKGGRLVIAHVKPVSIPVILKKEIEEYGLLAAMLTFVRLFRVGIINLILSGVHRKVYGIVTAGDITRYMKKRGYSIRVSKVMYRGFDDFMVIDKKGGKR